MTITVAPAQSNAPPGAAGQSRVEHPAPTAHPGEDSTAPTGGTATLDATRSQDLAYRWEQVSGSTVTLDDPATANPAFTVPLSAPHGTAYELQVTVTTSQGVTDTDTVTVTAAAPPGYRPPRATPGKRRRCRSAPY